MKMKALIIALVCTASALVAQPPDFPGEEALETVRFIRLAETKKQLDFLSEDQLLELNKILDDYEQKRFDIRKQEVTLRQQVKSGQADEEQAGQLLDEFFALRNAIHQNEMALQKDVRALLNNVESLAFFEFYNDFQRQIRRRIHMLRRGQDSGMPQRRNGPGRMRN